MSLIQKFTSMLGFTSAAQPTRARDGFSFVSYTTNDSTGFSATVFKSNAEQSYTIAVRGTEPTLGQALQDLIWADGGGVVLEVKAFDQLVQAFRYYKQITTIAGQPVQYTADELDMLGRAEAGALLGPGRGFLSGFLPSEITTAIGQVTALVLNDKGLGKLIPDGAVTNFTGHSLGGHVAYLLAEMVEKSRGDGFIGDVATYNAPGQNALAYEVLNWLGFPQSSTAGTIGGKHNAIIGAAGIEVTAGLGQVFGTRQLMFIEDIPEIAANHSIVKLSDSLAMYDLMTTIDPTLIPTENTDKIKPFLEAASNQGLQSLEKTLDALRQMILGCNPSPTLITGDSDSAPRTDYYANIKTLTTSSTFQALIGKVTLTAPPTGAGEARSDLGLFLSLYYLTPFALKTDGSIDADAQLTIANPDLATQFKDDKLLTPQEIYDGKANFSDMWLADRAAMLGWQSKLNKVDIVTSATQHVNYYSDGFLSGGNDAAEAPAAYFDDTTTQTAIYLGTETDRRQFIFGSNNDETGSTAINGGSKNDHFYGIGGNDTINGGDGNDYIEGGAGQDTLNGGVGVDVYQFTGTYGTDIITDSDGQGFITIDNNPLNSGTLKLENIYKNEALGTTITKVDGGTYTFSNGTTIRHSELLGTKLNSVVNIASADRALFGGKLDDILRATGTINATLYGGQGNDILISNTGNDTLYGSADNDLCRVQFLAQHLTQSADSNSLIVGTQSRSQCLVNQGLVAFAMRFAALTKARKHSIIQINGNTGFTLRAKHSTAFGLAHIIFSFHKVSFHKWWLIVQKLLEPHRCALSSIQLVSDPAHPFPPLQSAAHYAYRHQLGLGLSYRKTQAPPQQTQPHAYASWLLPSLGRIQSSCSNNTYNICINQQLTIKQAANDNDWRKAA
jgi:Ca2+-binding RTX toxin-like protein